jgi:dTDP-4-dehydrorhamnose reductase
MKIVLLGASGQLGREWQHFLNRRQKLNVILLPYTSQQLDITHFDEVRSEIDGQQPDMVINCAAYTKVDRAEDEREKARIVNADAVGNLARICSDAGCKLIHYSTDYVFPGRKRDRKANPEGYAEDHPTEPVNWYGQTKWEGEQAIRQITGDYLIIRVSWLCGQFGNNFVKTMLKLGRERDKVEVVNDQFGSPTFTENVVANCMHLLVSATGTYHITSKGLVTWYDFARSIFSISGMDVNLIPVSSKAFPTKAKRPYFSKLSTEKLESVTGSEIIDWETGLENLLAQLQNR